MFSGITRLIGTIVLGVPVALLGCSSTILPDAEGRHDASMIDASIETSADDSDAAFEGGDVYGVPADQTISDVPAMGGPVVALHVAGEDACALRADGSLYCWGTFEGTGRPVRMSGVADAVAFAIAGVRYCFVTRGGSVRCLDAAGTSSDHDVETVPGLSHVIDIVPFRAGFCALRSEGDVWCWLWYNNGSPVGPPAQVPGISRAVAITGSSTSWDEAACVLLSSGEVLCWGDNSWGQLGINDPTAGRTPVSFGGIGDAVQVVSGGFFVCALRRGGSVHCAGGNQFGTLGRGTSEFASPNVEPVAGLGDAHELWSGGTTTVCARRSDDSIVCWGSNVGGQIPLDSTNATVDESSVPIPVHALRDARIIALGDLSGCGVFSDRSLRCWGDSPKLRGEGWVDRDLTLPMPSVPIPDATALAGNQNGYCALAGGGVRCWGLRLGGRAATAVHASPGVPLSGVVELAGGGYQFSARLESGRVLCWTDISTDPAVIAGITNAVQLAVGDFYACARLDTGSVVCWGNRYGTDPVAVAGIDAATDVAAGSRFTLVVQRGQLYTAGPSGSDVWREFSDVVDVETGDSTFCVRDSHNVTTCRNSSSRPTVVPDVTRMWMAPSGGLCAQQTAGRLTCWNGSGLWVADMNLPTPEPIRSFGDPLSVAFREFGGCALIAPGDLRCRGQAPLLLPTFATVTLP